MSHDISRCDSGLAQPCLKKVHENAGLDAYSAAVSVNAINGSGMGGQGGSSQHLLGSLSMGLDGRDGLSGPSTLTAGISGTVLPCCQAS